METIIRLTEEERKQMRELIIKLNDTSAFMEENELNVDKKTILIVDDEMHIRDLVQKYATFENYESETAENGLEAIEKVKHNEYDLVIMDIMMPELDGFSAVKEIRKISQVPVIMLSARSEEYDKLYGFDLGIDDYVTKPFSPKELMRRVNAVLTRATHKNNQESATTNEVWQYKNLKPEYSDILLILKKRIEIEMLN